MGGAATSLFEERVEIRGRPRQFTRPGGVTVGQLLTRGYEAAQSGGSIDCPLCGGAMQAHGRDARCGECGSRLS
jgi:tRNA(Ile2) C34 agmatinyltransferase TiaS